MELKDRFLKYVSFDTQSDESSETFPSTAKQRVLLDYLAEEMKTLGLTEVTVDKDGKKKPPSSDSSPTWTRRPI